MAALSFWNLPHSVDIREVSPRDGLQIEAPISTEAKRQLLTALVETGVSRIEATAFVSPRLVPSMADAVQVASMVEQWPHVQFSALVPNLRGAQRAIDAGITNLEYVISASDGHSRANVGVDSYAATQQMDSIHNLVRSSGGLCEVIIATAWDCPFDGPTPPGRVLDIARHAVTLGVDRLSIADTIGTATPIRVASLYEAVQEFSAGISLGAHFHNTRGAGLANVLAAMSSGVRQFDSSIGGLGGCPFAPGASGNIATEELVYLLEGMGIDTGINLSRAISAAQLAQKLVGRTLSSSLLQSTFSLAISH
ncbi:MAG: hydroxymethylglutaryl-CoA lyase [Mycobacteriaceae bacterium]